MGCFQSLNNLKNQLQKLTSESNYLNKEIAARTEQLEKIFADNEAVAQVHTQKGAEGFSFLSLCVCVWLPTLKHSKAKKIDRP